MDVAKTDIERIGGSIEVRSVAGQGVTLSIKIPLTLAILPVLMVGCGEQRFAIPQVSVRELIHASTDRVRADIHEVRGTRVFELRGQLMPLVDLTSELDLRGDDCASDEQGVNIVVLEAKGRQFAVLVGDIHDSEEIVVKPIASYLRDLAVYSGATISGDGSVVLILDVGGLADRAHVGAESSRRSPLAAAPVQEPADLEGGGVLLFRVGAKRRMGLPLDSILRLEEIRGSAVEWADNRPVVQHRGRVLPLIDLEGLLDGTSAPIDAADRELRVVVCKHLGASVGVLIEEVLDIVDEAPPSSEHQTPDELFSTVVVAGRVTELLDLTNTVRRTRAQA
jgi:two-component system, chemotaxis family, sensor kinase CheA